MPTSNDEASKIVTISSEYLTMGQMAELFTRLDSEVGSHTTNDSLKVSLAMLRGLVKYHEIRPAPTWMIPALYALITLHTAIVIGIVMSFFILPFTAPWYVALPLCVFIWFFSTTKVDCQCTNLENHWRERVGWPPISSFVGHYFLKPVYRRMRRKMRKTLTSQPT